MKVLWIRFLVAFIFLGATVRSLSAYEVNYSSILPSNQVLYGIASWYSEADPYINKYTANGEVFDDSQMTCASWDYSFNTYLKVTNLDNGRSVVCRVNDRGPAKRLHRMIDLTKTAFQSIAGLRLGLIGVSVEPL